MSCDVLGLAPIVAYIRLVCVQSIIPSLLSFIFFGGGGGAPARVNLSFSVADLIFSAALSFNS